MQNNIHKFIRKEKTIFLPDIGTFFNNDVSLALNMVDKLSSYKIPIIKGEILHNENICITSDISESFYSNSKGKKIHENLS